MSDLMSVLIADDNVEYGSQLKECLCQYDDITVSGIAYDGIQTIELIKKLEPDIVVLDIVMPSLDGIGVLERLSVMQLKHRPLFIVLSAIGQDVFIHRAISLGAEYYILKPFDINMLVSRIRQVYREKYVFHIIYGKDVSKPLSKNPDADGRYASLEKVATEFLYKAGILPHIGGYQYLRDAIMMFVNDPSACNSLTKIVYPNIASKYKTTSRKVERAIRCAVYGAWEKGRSTGNIWVKDLFSNFTRDKPFNVQFISAMADMIKK